MRQFVHTPKNGIRVPHEMSPFVNTLKNEGFLVVNPDDLKGKQIIAQESLK